MNANKLEQLKQMTCVVADTGDLEAISRFKPEDATTNPTLILKAARLPQYKPLLKKAVDWSSMRGGSDKEQLANSVDKLAVDIGGEILKIVPGRVSTEVDARLSFDTVATVNKARQIVEMYEEIDVSPNRLLIKIASTWEGIKAAEILEKEGIRCNLTLLFSFAQAVACADAGAYLISPFVGRILDWHKSKSGIDSYPPEEDPGVASVSNIYSYYKQHHYETIVMGASFRNTEQVEQLAGCDRLTVSPQLLEALEASEGELTRKLRRDSCAAESSRVSYNEVDFRWHLNEDAMATEKLSEGIRGFAGDQLMLEQYLRTQQ